MNLKECQPEMRSAFLGGFAGQLVSGLIWLAAAGVSTLTSPIVGMAVLFFGSMGIFPLTQLFVRLMGRPGRGYFSMTDLSLASPLLVRLLEGGQAVQGSEEYLEAVNQACLDFFDRYLKGRHG